MSETTTETAPEPVSAEDVTALLEKERRRSSALQRERDEARQRAEAATLDARTSREQAVGSHLQQFALREDAIDRELAGVTRESETAEQQLEAAYEGSDYKKVAALQRQIATAEARAESLRVQKQMTARDREQAEAIARRQPDASAGGGPDMTRFSPAERAWLADKPEYFADDRLRTRLAGAHHEALADGVGAGSTEYFERLDAAYERHLGRASEASEAPAAPAATPRRNPAPAMPASRTPASRASAANPQAVVQLTADEKEAADNAMPDLPQNDRKGPGGELVPGRYRTYKMMQERLRAEGRLG